MFSLNCIPAKFITEGIVNRYWNKYKNFIFYSREVYNSRNDK